jgi:hypothetical protein
MYKCGRKIKAHEVRQPVLHEVKRGFIFSCLSPPPTPLYCSSYTGDIRGVYEREVEGGGGSFINYIYQKGFTVTR